MNPDITSAVVLGIMNSFLFLEVWMTNLCYSQWVNTIANV